MTIKLSSFKENNDVVHINMTPLIDIMLVLLIIFMVTSSIALESGLDIDIPKTTSITTPKMNNAIIVSLNKSGDVFLQGKKLPLELLKEKIKDALKNAKTKLVIFEGDNKSYLGKAIEIMDIAKEAGAERFAIAAEMNK